MPIMNLPFWRGENSSEPSLGDTHFNSESTYAALLPKSSDLLLLNINFQPEFCTPE